MMPMGVSKKSNSGTTPNSSVNCDPLTIVCRKGRMHRVHRVLEHLQVVAGIVVTLAGNQAVPLPFPAVGYRKLRHLLRRAHVGKDRSAELVHRVRSMAQTVLERRPRRLARRLQDGPVHVEKPAVVATADAPL